MSKKMNETWIEAPPDYEKYPDINNAMRDNHMEKLSPCPFFGTIYGFFVCIFKRVYAVKK